MSFLVHLPSILRRATKQAPSYLNLNKNSVFLVAIYKFSVFKSFLTYSIAPTAADPISQERLSISSDHNSFNGDSEYD